MDEKITFRPYILPSVTMSLGALAGLFLLLNYTLPSVWPRWAVFALLVAGVTGLALPLSYFINTRFLPRPETETITREALWAGVYAGILAWLQVGRFLSFSVALWIAIAIVIIEYILRVRPAISQPQAEPALPPEPAAPRARPHIVADETPDPETKDE
jgi:hypothetical protein